MELAKLVRPGETPNFIAVDLKDNGTIEINVRSQPGASSFRRGFLVAGQQGCITLTLREFSGILTSLSNGLRERGL